MVNKNIMQNNYTKLTLEDSFDLARTMVEAFKRKGFDYPPVLALEAELKSLRAQQFLKRKRLTQKIYRYVKKDRTTN